MPKTCERCFDLWNGKDVGLCDYHALMDELVEAVEIGKKELYAKWTRERIDAVLAKVAAAKEGKR